MKNSSLKKALAQLSLDNELEIINPETVKGRSAAADCGTKTCGTRTICIIKMRDPKIPIPL